MLFKKPFSHFCARRPLDFSVNWARNGFLIFKIHVKIIFEQDFHFKMDFFNHIKKSQFTSMGIAPTNRKLSFFIMCGLPGTGKTTLSEKIKNYFAEDEAIILSRDKIRGNILWDIRKASKEEQQAVLNNLDSKVTEKIIEILKKLRKEFEYKAIIIDGCHTNCKTLTTLISAVDDYKNNCNIFLCIVGDHTSQCCHKITNKSEGDYSDYKEDLSHDSVPDCVISKKRTELELLLSKYLEAISYYIDAICTFPAYSK